MTTGIHDPVDLRFVRVPYANLSNAQLKDDSLDGAILDDAHLRTHSLRVHTTGRCPSRGGDRIRTSRPRRCVGSSPKLVGRAVFADGGVGRRAHPDDRAGNPRRGQEDLVPDRRGGAQVRPDLGPDRCYGCPGLSLPAGSLSHRPEPAPHLDGVFHGPDELLRGLGQLVPASAGRPVRRLVSITATASVMKPPYQSKDSLSRVWTSYCNNQARGRPSMPAP